jgi:exopolysaccharide production protein ExoY
MVHCAMMPNGGRRMFVQHNVRGDAPRLLPQKIFLSSPSMNSSMIRLLDIVIAGLATLFLLPLMIFIGSLVLATSRGPAFFTQERIGRNGEIFCCLKFRTMAGNAQELLDHILRTDANASLEWSRDHKLRRDPRITALGKFLRRSSLDELPQLLNVLRGDMSLVGPRPIVADEARRYGRYFSHYCRVRPGITGLWQVSGRSNLSYRRRVALDVTFARSCSTALYLRILALTIPCVLLQRGSC